MPTFKKVNDSDNVAELLAGLLLTVEQHAPIRERKVRVDLLFAYSDKDEKTSEPTNNALTHHGVKALAVTKKIGLADRAKGMGDVEIRIDGDWWLEHSEEDQAALLDHELTHIVVSDKTDDLSRPKIVLRNHDYQIGWFRSVAARHGRHSCECQQAAKMMTESGQFFWPEITGALSDRGSRVTKLETAPA